MLQRTVQVVCEVMETKAASIRLIDVDKTSWSSRPVYNLSDEYLNKGPVRLSTAADRQLALSPVGFEYVRNMATDPRVQYPQESIREGIVSMLSVGMRVQGQADRCAAGVHRGGAGIQPLKIDLLKAVAAQAAAAIENTRLLDETLEAAGAGKAGATWPPMCSSG